jgi:hypothetical protein
MLLRDRRLGTQINLDGFLRPARAQLTLHASVTFLTKQKRRIFTTLNVRCINSFNNYHMLVLQVIDMNMYFSWILLTVCKI